jgi:tRNA uridine 5-carboxymethylaminomethyl modification enzyme
MTYTSLDVHDILREGFDRSPMFNGRIKSMGPRYCPSIEDKINRFADKKGINCLSNRKVGKLVRYT